MLSTHPSDVGPRAAAGRHAADEPDPPAEPAPRWWRRWTSAAGVSVDGGQLVVRIRGPLDVVTVGQPRERVGELRLHQVVVVHLGACDFVDVRGFRALLQLQDQVQVHTGRLLVLDPPRTLRIMCAAVPDRLTLVPDSAVAPADRA